jgi:hypothetical protein
MLYDNENISSKERRIDMLDKMLNTYKNTGGFGIYNIESMIGNNIRRGDIGTMIQQEDSIINMYNNTYDSNITRNILENEYLGRKCVSVNGKCKYGIIPNYNNNKKDQLDVFLRMNSIRGYNQRIYWKEREIEKKRFNIEQYDKQILFETVTIPTLERSK